MEIRLKIGLIWVLLTIPSILLSQSDSNNMFVGGFRMDRLSYEKSADGIRKDIDLGLDIRYLRKLSKIQPSDSLIIVDGASGKIPISRHWLGVISGFSGYYVNSDSAIIRGSEIQIGPTYRYYASTEIFLEATVFLLYSWSKIWTPAPINPGNWYIPRTEFAGLRSQLGIGYSKQLARSIFLEPFVGYQFYGKWIATKKDQQPFELYQISNNFVFSLCFQYRF